MPIGSWRKITQPALSVEPDGGANAGELVETLTATPATPAPLRSTTFTPRMPCVLLQATLGATSESILTGLMLRPTIFEVTVEVMCRYSLFLLELPQLGVPPESSVIQFAFDSTL